MHRKPRRRRFCADVGVGNVLASASHAGTIYLRATPDPVGPALPTEPSTLTIAGREIARAESGPLEAEYALFEADNIELRRPEPQTVREIGYLHGRGRTHVSASPRSERRWRRPTEPPTPCDTGWPSSTRGDPSFAGSRARSAPVSCSKGASTTRRSARTRACGSDTHLLATHLGAGAAPALQLVHLVALLYDVPDDAGDLPVDALGVDDPTPGIPQLPSRVGGGARQSPRPARRARGSPCVGPFHESGPSRVEILDEIGASMAIANEAAHERLAAVQRAMSVARPPPMGPALGSRRVVNRGANQLGRPGGSDESHRRHGAGEGRASLHRLPAFARLVLDGEGGATRDRRAHVEARVEVQLRRARAARRASVRPGGGDGAGAALRSRARLEPAGPRGPPRPRPAHRESRRAGQSERASSRSIAGAGHRGRAGLAGPPLARRRPGSGHAIQPARALGLGGADALPPRRPDTRGPGSRASPRASTSRSRPRPPRGSRSRRRPGASRRGPSRPSPRCRSSSSPHSWRPSWDEPDPAPSPPTSPACTIGEARRAPPGVQG